MEFGFLVSGMVMFGRLACACDFVLPVMFRFLVGGFVFLVDVGVVIACGVWILVCGVGRQGCDFLVCGIWVLGRLDFCF